MVYKRRGNSKWVSKGLQRTCVFCCKTYISGKNSLGIYCSNRCQQDFKWNEEKKIIESSDSFKNERQAKRFLIEVFGNICSLCNNKLWLGQPIPIVLDHKDGNHTNHKKENVRLLCNNCDAIQPTFKNKNKGNGRFCRRERYRNGLSY